MTMPTGSRESKTRRVAPLAAEVVHLSAEYLPFARTGGLAEAVTGLVSYQAAAGVTTTALMPLFRSVRDTGAPLVPFSDPFTVAIGAREEPARLWRLDRAEGPRGLFLEHEAYFDRDGLYGADGADYPDNGRRFGYLCRAALEALPRIARAPMVLHLHDWHTALAAVYLRTEFRGRSPYDSTAAVLTVHNAGFQGHFPFESLADLGLSDELYDWQRLEWHGRVNWLKGGLVFADMATTVSPTHAYELRTETGGFGLHETFISLGDRLVGILNGIDQDAWDPARDPHLTAAYSVEDLEGKARCKRALQRGAGLPLRARAPLFALSARLAAQKGIDLILDGQVLDTPNAQFVLLGEGEARYAAALAGRAAAAPERIAYESRFTDRFEHRLLAGADILLMPSLYEPCGLTQMRAQRYGALPVARRVGGLADTIDDEDTGFLFDEYTPAALEVAVRRALALYARPADWDAHVRRAMMRGFGWEHRGPQYLDLYRRALARRAAVEP
jgi:starch synthase